MKALPLMPGLSKLQVAPSAMIELKNLKINIIRLKVNSIKTVYSRHTKQPIEKVYAGKGYAGKPNREFLALNNIADGIMRKDSTIGKLTKIDRF